MNNTRPHDVSTPSNALPEACVAPEDAYLAEATVRLRARFIVRLLLRVKELREALARAPNDAVVRDELRRAGHQWRGSAGVVGLSEVSALGRIIEGAAAGQCWGPTEIALVRDALDRATRAAEAVRADSLTPLRR